MRGYDEALEDFYSWLFKQDAEIADFIRTHPMTEEGKAGLLQKRERRGWQLP